MPLADQITAFAWTLAIGMLAGLCYEAYRAVKDAMGLKKVGTFTGDIVFWIFLTAFAFILLVRANYGQLRLYVFIGLLIGALLFTHLLGGFSYRLIRLAMRLAGRVLRLAALILFYIWKAVTFPFRIIFLTLVFPARLGGMLLGRAGRLSGQLAGRPVSWAKGRAALWAEKILRRIAPRR